MTNQTTIDVTNLTLGEIYEFRVKAFNDFSESDLTEAIVVQYLEQPTVPRDILEVQRGDSSVFLKWDQESNGGDINNYFTVYQSTEGGEFTEVHTDLRRAEVTIEDLVPGANYSFKIMSTNRYMQSEMSEPFNLWFLISPGVPTGLRTTLMDNGDLALFWLAPSFFGGVQQVTYTVMLKTGNEPFTAVDTRIPSTTYTFTDLTQNTQYTFVVQTNNDYTSSIVSKELQLFYVNGKDRPSGLKERINLRTFTSVLL